MFTTYVIYSRKNDKIYIGHTGNLIRRLIEHNTGQTKSTKRYIPWEIVYKEEHSSRKEAMRREKELKTNKGRSFIREQILINGRACPSADGLKS